MSLSRQQRRAVNRQAAKKWVNQNGSEHSRGERKQFTRQLVSRLNHELPRSTYEPEGERQRIIAPDDSPLVVPVNSKVVIAPSMALGGLMNGGHV